MKNLSKENDREARIRSLIWDFLHKNDWADADDFSLVLSKRIHERLLHGSFSLENSLKILGGIRTTFFMVNRISKKQFVGLLISDLGRKLTEIAAETSSVILLNEPKALTKSAKILFLAANPSDTVRLRLDKEAREIQHGILLAQKKDQLILVNKGAVRIRDLQFYLNQEKPTIVHFSGHGSSEGRIVLEDDLGNAKTVPPKALARVFSVLKDNIRCVVLNACFSFEQARAISQHIDCVIGMSSSISDRTAIAFSTAFYVAIASERSLKNSFEQGINEIMLLGIPEGHIPRLLSRDNVDPSQIYPLASISPEVDSTASRKVIVHSKRRKPEPIQFIEGITAHLFFPVETSEENRSLDYHERHLHHRIIANHKMHPPKAYYMTPNSDGWRFIMEYPEYWVSEIVTDEGYKTNDPNFMQRWCDNYGYSLKRKVAEIKDLLESD